MQSALESPNLTHYQELDPLLEKLDSDKFPLVFLLWDSNKNHLKLMWSKILLLMKKELLNLLITKPIKPLTLNNYKFGETICKLLNKRLQTKFSLIKWKPKNLLKLKLKWQLKLKKLPPLLKRWKKKLKKKEKKKLKKWNSEKHPLLTTLNLLRKMMKYIILLKILDSKQMNIIKEDLWIIIILIDSNNPLKMLFKIWKSITRLNLKTIELSTKNNSKYGELIWLWPRKKKNKRSKPPVFYMKTCKRSPQNN